MGDFFSEIWVRIVAGILVAVIIGLYWKLHGKIHERVFFYSTVKKKARASLKELKKSRTEHIVAKDLMYFIAKQSGIHLFSADGEDVSLWEYAEILNRSIESLTSILKKIYLIELTLPSDWYSNPTESKERADIIKIVRRYFDQQKSLKRTKGERITIKRYLVQSRDAFYSDPKKDEFINEHHENNLELYLCPAEKIRAAIYDTSIFIDEKERGWVIRSLNFNTDSLKNPTRWIRVQIEDRQSQIQNFYQTLIQELEMYAIKLAPK